jgi:hypothetical protein
MLSGTSSNGLAAGGVWACPGRLAYKPLKVSVNARNLSRIGILLIEKKATVGLVVFGTIRQGVIVFEAGLYRRFHEVSIPGQ